MRLYEKRKRDGGAIRLILLGEREYKGVWRVTVYKLQYLKQEMARGQRRFVVTVIEKQGPLEVFCMLS